MYGDTIIFQLFSVAQILASYHIWKRTPLANMTPTSTKSIAYFLAESPDWYHNLWHLNIPDGSTLIRKLISYKREIFNHKLLITIPLRKEAIMQWKCTSLKDRKGPK